MDIVRFKGGLGNQMFQYAFYQALRYRNRTVKANLGYYDRNPETRRFCLTNVFPNIVLEYIANEKFESIECAWKKIKSNKEVLQEFLLDYSNRFFWVEEEDACFEPKVYETQNCTFVGYWQSAYYFSDINEVLLRRFEFSYGEEKLDYLRKLFLNNRQYVSVHIRRGDYLKHAEAWGVLSESKYYQRAIRFMEERIEKPIFVFFSDDIQWTKERYNYRNAVYIEHSMFEKYESWYDMCLMSCCTHNIVANSSFSWWGAWLNRNDDKIVIAPSKWYFDGRKAQNICPNEWKRIDVN